MFIIKIPLQILGAFLLLSFLPACKAKESNNKKVKPAMAGNFLSADTTGSKKDSIHIRQGGSPVVRVMKNNAPVSGTYTLHGSLAFSGPADMRMDSADQTVSIHLNLPKDMRIAAVKEPKAFLVSDYSQSPAGTDALVKLFSGDRLFLGYIWQTSEHPLSLTAPAGKPELRQVALRALPSQAGSAAVETELVTDNGVMNIRPAVLTTFKSSGADYQAYLEVSIYMNASKSSDGNSGYILKAIITKL